MKDNDLEKAKQWILNRSNNKSIKRFNPCEVAKQLHIYRQIFTEACIEAVKEDIIIAEYWYLCDCGKYTICKCLEDIPENCQDCGKELNLHSVFIMFNFNTK